MVNPNKPAKVRRVLNGAAKFQKASLINSLLTGPDLLQNLIHTLLRFREHKFDVSADIEGMFLQVGVLEQDQPSIRFLWWDALNDDIEVYQYVRHIFGAKDSPTCANYALQRTAAENAVSFADAARAVTLKFYMDDYLDSLHTSELALRRSKDLVELLAKGGFKLTKFESSFPALTAELNVSELSLDTEQTKAISDTLGTSSHVLGLKWDQSSDSLVVSRGTNKDVPSALTQRAVLSLVAAVFDPIGLVEPFTVRARLLLKDIWRVSGQQWDDQLPTDIAQRISEWIIELPRLSEMAIPRSYFPVDVDQIELHLFGDSSQEVFSTVAFLRGRPCVVTNANPFLSFVIGKTRVAPMKSLTVHKLELQAALLAARLCAEIHQVFTRSINKTFLWSDSTTVLQWLQSTTVQPIFLANRVCEMLELTTIDQWNYVSSSENPADAGPRGLSAEALKSSSWYLGPECLRSGDWPFKPDNAVLNDLKKGTGEESALPSSEIVASPAKIIQWENFSSFKKLQRILVYILRILSKHSHFRTPDRKIVDYSELSLAESKLLSMAQRETFHLEMKNLSEGKQLHPKSRIRAYPPFISASGLMRSTGRVKRLSEITYDVKHPIILDGRHRLVDLLLQHLHEMHYHPGVDFMRAQVQQRYAVLKLRNTLRKIESSCLVCRRRKVETLSPMMADLPIERLSFQKPPFTMTGVDYFGPLFVTVRRSSEKRWGFLFTCLTTRAVHLEVVPSLDTNLCVMGILRFAGRRGTPSVIWSDNGTNFVGSETELVENIRKWNEQAPELLVHKKITWKFNPPVRLTKVGRGSV